MPFLKKVFCDVGCVVKPKCFFKYWMCQAQMFFKCQICQSSNVYIPNSALPDSFTEGSFIYSFPQYTPLTAFQLNFPIFPFYKMSKRQARDMKLQTNLQIVKPADNFAYTKHPRLGFIQLPHQ